MTNHFLKSLASSALICAGLAAPALADSAPVAPKPVQMQAPVRIDPETPITLTYGEIQTLVNAPMVAARAQAVVSKIENQMHPAPAPEAK